MYSMSTSSSMVLCRDSIGFGDTGTTARASPHAHKSTQGFAIPMVFKKQRLLHFAPYARKRRIPDKKRSWWQKLFSDENDEKWSDLSAEDVLSDAEGADETTSEEERFEAWKRKAEAISELQEAREDARNAEGREWEDWLGEVLSNTNGSSWDQDRGKEVNTSGDISEDPDEILWEKGIVGAINDLVVRNDNDDLLFEDRVFQYASTSSAKFIALLILVPWALDFLVHDFVLMPFLDRYVKTVPLAAEMLDVRRQQKLEMIKTLKVERARFRLEVEIGKSPPLSDEEIWLELRRKAIELRDEWRLENRRAFANIWSDMVYGIALFLLIYLNKSKVALLKFTGYKLFNNISDTGKAFLIILVTDIFLGPARYKIVTYNVPKDGPLQVKLARYEIATCNVPEDGHKADMLIVWYHSESGWQALVEIILERYGLEVDQAAITIFVCIVPVVIDACVKLWLFKFLPKLSPNVTNIFREMKRH